MDCTSSMSACIHQAKTHIVPMATSISEQSVGSAVEMGFVCYRDFDYKNGNIVPHPFTAGIADLQAFITTLSATGGADIPEDMAGGFAEAFGPRFAWRTADDSKRFVVLVADAPCHGGERFYDGKDSHPDGGASGMPDPWLAKMRNESVQLIFTRINSCTDKMISEFRKMYDSEERSITVVDLGGHDTEMFASSVCDAIVEELATHAM